MLPDCIVLGGVYAVCHQLLQPPQVAVVDAELFELADGCEEVLGHRTAEAAGDGEKVGGCFVAEGPDLCDESQKPALHQWAR